MLTSGLSGPELLLQRKESLQSKSLKKFYLYFYALHQDLKNKIKIKEWPVELDIEILFPLSKI